MLQLISALGNMAYYVNMLLLWEKHKRDGIQAFIFILVLSAPSGNALVWEQENRHADSVALSWYMHKYTVVYTYLVYLWPFSVYCEWRISYRHCECYSGHLVWPCSCAVQHWPRVQLRDRTARGAVMRESINKVQRVRGRGEAGATVYTTIKSEKARSWETPLKKVIN